MANNIQEIWRKMGIDPEKGTGTYKNRMGLGSTIVRDNGIPVDISSIHETLEDAIVYAATNPIAYVNQIIAAEGNAYIIVDQPLGTVKISKYRDSITGKIIKDVEKEYQVFLKPLISQNGEGGTIEVTEGEGIDINESIDGRKVISIEKGGITDDHISSVSINKLIQDDNIVLILNGGKAK